MSKQQWVLLETNAGKIVTELLPSGRVSWTRDPVDLEERLGRSCVLRTAPADARLDSLGKLQGSEPSSTRPDECYARRVFAAVCRQPADAANEAPDATSAGAKSRCERTSDSGTPASKSATPWEELHRLIGATTPSLEAPPPSGDCYSGAERTEGLATLRERYNLGADQIASFQRRRYLRIAGFLPPALLVEARSRIIELTTRATGGRDVSVPVRPQKQPGPGASQEDLDAWWAQVSEPAVRSWHIQQMWAVDPVVKAIVLSPRIGDMVCGLLGCDAVRLYHDNALSRAPGSKPTRWHCDDGPAGYMVMGSPKVVTVWIPLQRTLPTMGSLIFSHRAPGAKEAEPPLDAWGMAALHKGGLPDEQTAEYDGLVSAALQDDGHVPDIATYELGDVSIHMTGCFHRTGPNMAGTPRVILAATYFADGTTARCDVDIMTASQGIKNDWKKFAPDVKPGDPVATWLNPVLRHACDA